MNTKDDYTKNPLYIVNHISPYGIWFNLEVFDLYAVILETLYWEEKNYILYYQRLSSVNFLK